MRRTLAAMIALLTTAGLLGLEGAATAQGLPPRPEPTSEPRREEERREAPGGRITGTIIDLTTGAPAPGVPVTVGDVTVVSDANGNYDRGALPAGSYAVALALDPALGAPSQEPLLVELAAGATVVQHLGYRSPAPSDQPGAAAAPPPPSSLPPTGGPTGRPAVLLALVLLCLGVGVRLRVPVHPARRKPRPSAGDTRPGRG